MYITSWLSFLKSSPKRPSRRRSHQTIFGPAVDSLEDRTLLAASISGVVWEDLDGDNGQDADEPGIGNVPVYLDFNENGQHDTGEPLQQTATDGSYTFDNLSAGQYTVAQTVPVGFEQTTPDPGSGNTLFTERVASGLDTPVALTAAPGDGDRIFIVEKNARAIRIVDLASGQLLATPFLTIPDADIQGQGGVLDVAFHPDYASNGKFYVRLTVDNGGVPNDGGISPFSSYIREYTVSADDPNVADLASERDIMSWVQPRDDHVAGWMAFSPDGYLYTTTGDGGKHPDPDNNSQRIEDELLGKVLRIDVNGDDFPADPDRNYAIPATNPFVGETGDDEIWAYGLRNPWRASFDRQTGDLWIGDVGEDAREEIDFQPASSPGGENYGWNRREGAISYDGRASLPGDVEPVYDYPHGSGAFEGNSVVGGYVYRGPIPQLEGLYLFGDTISTHVWTFDPSDPAGTVQNIDSQLIPDVGSIGFPVAFGEDAAGNLYIVDYSFSNEGEVFRIRLDLPAAQTVVLATDEPRTGIDFGNQQQLPDFPVAENFNSDADDFVYADDVFGTNQPGYADGSWIAGGGPDGSGALSVTVGGIDGSDIVDGMSGGWQRDFTLGAATPVMVSFDYQLTHAGNYETDEWSELRYRLDGGPAVVVDRIDGDGQGGAPQTTGWQNFTVDLGELPAGTHTLTMGVYNNKKTFSDESTEVSIDNVSVEVSSAGSPDSAFAGFDEWASLV